MSAVEEELRCRVETAVRAMCVCDNDGGEWAKAPFVAVPVRETEEEMEGGKATRRI